jgi:hypothetical protein
MTGTQVTNSSPHSKTVTVDGGRKLQITGIGNVTINESHGLITLQNVFLIPELVNTNLISWSCIAEKRLTTTRTENSFTIYKPNSKEVIGVANANSTGLYILKPRNLTHTSPSPATSMTGTNDSDISPLPRSHSYSTWSLIQNRSPQQVTWKHATHVNSPNPPNHTSLLLPNHDSNSH